ncbi:hypothetical protein [Pedobacter sp. CFBP9032]|uniref:hypothetical protein n=1 Tax=Pedobacter sp. CFBP9032 TaxID=3096539 RepID=UPI002A6B88B4|nr:hypothetical protein [Pedobacter sp. CFBP9032]MDY0906603.1 hypothetical protein [Pedobacter sp. CFBP9032]
MKKLITLFLLMFTTLILKAQTADETLEWLRTKQPSLGGNSVTIDQKFIKVTNDKDVTSIEWSKIKDVTRKNFEIKIVGDELLNGKNIFINIRVDDFRLSDKFVKALRHLAELKGAKLIKDDLF